ncbi:hypothetical protein HF521_000354 [Silurus meridionalis]|uniref:Uncharacterized protein n=1 Tax=Silurus meridionalis TaxID=175797 RepID=A0A8T0BY93_SILME|nr:hypothetical protein HF521_000354 [Silurus meridionalis]
MMSGKTFKTRSTTQSQLRPGATGPKSLRSELQAVKAQLSSDKVANEAAVQELKDTVVEMERSLSVCTDDIAVMQRDIHRLTAEYNKLETKCEDLEARSRRNNVRIIGVPEGPNSSTTASVAVLLKEALSLEKEPVLDRSEIIEVFKAELRALERTLGNDLLTIKSELQAVKAQLSSDKVANEAAVQELKDTVVEMERSLSVCTDDIAVMQRDIHRLTAEYNKLETKCEDLEARSRRNNVRIIGVPEGPNSSTTASVAVLLKEALSLEKEPVLDRSQSQPAASKADIDSLKSELLSSLRSEIIEVFKAELRALERTLGNDLLTMKSELQAVKAQLSSDKVANEAAVQELKDTVVEMERSLSVCTDDIAVMQRDIHRLTAEYNKLETKCEDLEARSRRNNVRIIGVPEGPNSSTTASVAVLLKEALSLEKEPVLDRAHCFTGSF